VKILSTPDRCLSSHWDGALSWGSRGSLSFMTFTLGSSFMINNKHRIVIEYNWKSSIYESIVRLICYWKGMTMKFNMCTGNKINFLVLCSQIARNSFYLVHVALRRTPFVIYGYNILIQQRIRDQSTISQSVSICSFFSLTAFRNLSSTIAHNDIKSSSPFYNTSTAVLPSSPIQSAQYRLKTHTVDLYSQIQFRFWRMRNWIFTKFNVGIEE